MVGVQWLRDKVPAKAKKAYAGPGRVLSFCRDDTRVAAHLRIILVYYRNSFHESARGATRKENHPQCLSVISIHAPCAGATINAVAFLYPSDISIHAPCAGGNALIPSHTTGIPYFNPRPPARGATAKLYNFQNHCNLFCITFLPIRLLNPI